MSDVANPSAPAAPAAAPTPAPAAPAPAPAAQPSAPTTRAEARAALRTPVAPAEKAPTTDPATPATPQEPKVDATGRAHGEDGKFVEKPKDGTPAPEKEPGTEPAATSEKESQLEEKPDAKAADEVPEGHVRIPVPEELQRNFGHERIVPEKDAEFFRFTLNVHTKRKAEIAEAQGRADEYEQRLAQHEAALRVANEFTTLLLTDPRILEAHNQIRQDHGPEEAARWMQGLMNEHGQNASKYATEAMQKVSERRQQAAAKTWLRESFEASSAKVPEAIVKLPEYESHFLRAQAAYSADLQLRERQGERTQYDADEFFQDFLAPRLRKIPQVMSALEQARAQREQQAAAAAAEKGKERERAALDQTKQRIDEIPMAAVPAAVSTGHEPAGAPQKAPSYREARRALRRA